MPKGVPYPSRRIAGVRLLEAHRDPHTLTGTKLRVDFVQYGIRLTQIPIGVAFEHAGHGWGTIDVLEFHESEGADRYFDAQALATPSDSTG